MDAPSDRLRRGQALLDRPGGRHPRNRSRVHRRRHGWRHPGRFDDHRAVRQERAAEQGNRTIFEKLREAALAYHLTRRWSTRKILTEYLNSIYFGNGAYGVESAARVYFGKVHGYDPNAATDGSTGGCGDSTGTIHRPTCASVLTYWESALLAGMVANPSAFNPLEFPGAAMDPPRARAQGHARAALHHPVGVRVRDQPAAADRGGPAAAPGAAGGPVLHQLAAAADPGRDGSRSRCAPIGAPSTAPTTAASRFGPRWT